MSEKERTISTEIDLKYQMPESDTNKYITEVNDGGIKIHPKIWEGEKSYIQLNGEGVFIKDFNNIALAKFTADGAQIGIQDGTHTNIDDTGLSIYDNNTELASFFVDEIRLGEKPNSSKRATPYIDMEGFHIKTYIGRVPSLQRLDSICSVGLDFGRMTQMKELSKTEVVTIELSNEPANNTILYIFRVNSAGQTRSLTQFVKGTPEEYTLILRSDPSTGWVVSYDGNKTFTTTPFGDWTHWWIGTQSLKVAYQMYSTGKPIMSLRDLKDNQVFYVGEDGNIKVLLNTKATSGVDKEIYDALISLGWDSDVVSRNVMSTKMLFNKLLWDLVGETHTITSFDSGWAVYDTNSVVTVARRGDIVTLTGALRNTASKTLNTSGQYIFSVPAELAPKVPIIELCQGSGTALWTLRVTNGSGAVSFERYRNMGSTSYPSISAGTWFPFAVTWTI